MSSSTAPASAASGAVDGGVVGQDDGYEPERPISILKGCYQSDEGECRRQVYQSVLACGQILRFDGQPGLPRFKVGSNRLDSGTTSRNFRCQRIRTRISIRQFTS